MIWGRALACREIIAEYKARKHDMRIIRGTGRELVGMESLSYAGHCQNGRPTAKWNVKSRERRG